MPLVPCPDCGAQISDAAPACIHCGRPAASLAPETAPADSDANEPSARRVLSLMAAVLGFGFVAVLVSSCPRQTASAADHGPLSAEQMCRQFALDRLRAPSTARFASLGDADVTDHGGGRYRVQTHIDAQNAFGAMIRSRIDCTVRWVGGDEWRLEHLNLE